MDKDDREKLRILLNHWVEHNQEHAEEFNRWAEKARQIGEEKVQSDLLESIQHTNRASEFLLRALNRLTKSNC